MRLIAGAAALAIVGVAGPASAQAPASAPLPGYAPPPAEYAPNGSPAYPPWYGYASYAPPPPNSPSDAYRHDGFYLRMAVGVGLTRGMLAVSFPPILERETMKVVGIGPAFAVAVGGAVVDWLIIAGELSVTGTSSPNVAASGTTWAGDRFSSPALWQVLMIADVYPAPRRGFYVQGGLGMTGYSVTVSAADASGYSATRVLGGLGWHLGAGWEGWVSEQWGIGGLIRLDGASVAYTDVENGPLLDGTVLSPKVLFTATFN